VPRNQVLLRIPVKSATHSGIKSAAYRSVATLLT
jgi:hypothetical protein